MIIKEASNALNLKAFASNLKKDAHLIVWDMVIVWEMEPANVLKVSLVKIVIHAQLAKKLITNLSQILIQEMIIKMEMIKIKIEMIKIKIVMIKMMKTKRLLLKNAGLKDTL